VLDDNAFIYDTNWVNGSDHGLEASYAGNTNQCVARASRLLALLTTSFQSNIHLSRYSESSLQRFVTISPTVSNANKKCIHAGNAIKLYGATGPDHGIFSVSLDDALAQNYNGTAPFFRPQTLLVNHDFLVYLE
jgi:hypothetical protein